MNISRVFWIFLFLLSIVVFVSCTDDRTNEEILARAIELHDKKDFKAAYDEIEKLVQRTNTSEANYLKGLLEVDLKKNSEALLSFRTAFAMDTTNYKALVERGRLKIALGDVNGAIADCDHARLIKRDDPEIYKVKAYAFETLADLQNAIISYEVALKYSNESELHYRLGALYVRMGRIDKACDHLRAAADGGHMKSFDLIKLNCNKKYDLPAEKTTNKTSTNDQSYNWKIRHGSQKYNYSIEIPESFTKEVGIRPHIDLKFADSFGSSIIVTVVKRQAAEYNITAHDFNKEQIENQFKNAMPNVAIMAVKKLYIGGERAFLFEQEGAYENLKSLNCFLYHDDAAYNISATCEKYRFENYKKLFWTAIQSLKFNT